MRGFFTEFNFTFVDTPSVECRSFMVDLLLELSFKDDGEHRDFNDFSSTEVDKDSRLLSGFDDFESAVVFSLLNQRKIIPF